MAGLTLVGVPLGEPLPANGLPDNEDELRVDLGAADFTAERCTEVAARAAAFVGKLAELPELASPHLPAVQSVHAATFDAVVYVPASHAVHVVAPALVPVSVIEPAWQLAQYV